MKHVVENDFQQKIMFQSWSEPFHIRTLGDVQKWRDSWQVALKSWHSPYKCGIDLSNVTISDEDGEVAKALQRMLRFFEGFFLKKVVGYGLKDEISKGFLNFPLVATEEEANREIGVRERRGAGVPADFRSSIQLQNHFNQHVIELSFSQPAVVKGKEEIVALKSKITNALMQWHSKWSLLIDCSQLTFEPEGAAKWPEVEKFLRSFFMKHVLGYSPSGPKESYPFETFRARHNAAGRLEGEGNFAGDDAQCRSDKKA